MSNPEPFQRLLTLLGREGEPVRICRGNATDFRVALVPFELLGEALEVLERDQWNVWYELNPSVFNEPMGRSRAADVTRLAALYADLDFKPAPQGLGSHDAAMEVIADLSAALGTQPAAIVHSGGGLQPYWPLEDVPVTDDNRNSIATLLKRWGLLVKQVARGNGGDADNVFDLPRILRVPGSINFKDPQNPKPTAIDFFEVAPLTVAEISTVLDDYGIPDEFVEISGETISPLSDWAWADSECAWVDVARREIKSSQPASRHHWALKWAALLYGMVRSGCLTEAGFYELRSLLVDRFKVLLAREQNSRPFSAREMESIFKTGQAKAESWSQVKLGEEMRQHPHDMSELFAPIPTPFSNPAPRVAEPAIEPEPILEVEPAPSNVSSIFSRQRVDASTQGALALDIRPATAQRLLLASQSDLGNAEKFGQWIRGRYIHVHDMGWLAWDGARWIADDGNSVQEAAKDMLTQSLAAAGTDDARKWLHNSMSRTRIVAMLELTKSLPHLAQSPLALDSKAFELNTPNGILHLDTAELRAPDPTVDFHTKQTLVNAEAIPITKYLRFLHWAMGEDGDSIIPVRTAYLQRLFGLALIGKLLHHVFPIFLGSGSNGKSALLSIWDRVLGDYSLTLPPKFLMHKANSEHPTSIAQLRGARLAIASEVPPNSRFDEDLVKIITGETRLRARLLYQNNFTFENTVTVFLAANHLPAVQVGGTGFWRRTKKIDFSQHMPIARQDPHLADTIVAEEGPGILWWGLEGAMEVLRNGLQDPHSVRASTREYELEEDVIARFLDEHVERHEGITIQRSHLFEMYQRWVFRQGIQPLPYIKFCREVVQIDPQTNLGSKAVFTDITTKAVSFDFELED